MVRALELLVAWAYMHDRALTLPYQKQRPAASRASSKLTPPRNAQVQRALAGMVVPLRDAQHLGYLAVLQVLEVPPEKIRSRSSSSREQPVCSIDSPAKKIPPSPERSSVQRAYPSSDGEPSDCTGASHGCEFSLFQHELTRRLGPPLIVP